MIGSDWSKNKGLGGVCIVIRGFIFELKNRGNGILSVK